MGGRKSVGPVTAAIRALQEICDDPAEPEFINAAGDVIGIFGIGVKRFTRPTAKRRTLVPVGIISVGQHGCISVGQHGCLARVYGAGNSGDLGTFRTAAEAERAILDRSHVKAHPIILPPAGSARH